MRNRPALVLVAVSVAGGVGALMRWGLAELGDGSSWPWPTLVANGAGTVVAAAVVAAAVRGVVSRAAAAVAAAGFCGGLTTFSTFIAELDRLGARDPWRGAVWALAHAVVLVAAVVGGRRMATP